VALEAHPGAGGEDSPPAAPAFDGYTWINDPYTWSHAMRTNIEIDDDLMREAMRATGERTKRAVVERGLRLLVQIRGQARIRRLRGKVTWRGDLDDSRRTRDAVSR
jgi:Arc/MetJ family transcription regulator